VLRMRTPEGKANGLRIKFSEKSPQGKNAASILSPPLSGETFNQEGLARRVLGREGESATRQKFKKYEEGRKDNLAKSKRPDPGGSVTLCRRKGKPKQVTVL